MASGKLMSSLSGVVVFAVLLFTAARALSLDDKYSSRIENSPQWKDGRFVNPNGVEVKLLSWEALTITMDYLSTIARRDRKDVRPAKPVPVVKIDPAEWTNPDPKRLDYAWLGHASVLVALEGRIILFDPVFEKRASPVSWYGPERFFPPPINAATLPPVDVVVITHGHYDHLEEPTVGALAKTKTTFMVPLGARPMLEKWGVDPERIVELDWWESYDFDGIRFHATPAIHNFMRGLFDFGQQLWCSWVVEGAGKKFFVSGDSGYYDGFAEVGKRFGPFDVAFLKIGSYSDKGSWRKEHMTPEEAIRQAEDIRAAAVVPVHWATFDLELFSWHASIERTVKKAVARDVTLVTPVPGRKVSSDQRDVDTYWWRELMASE